MTNVNWLASAPIALAVLWVPTTSLAQSNPPSIYEPCSRIVDDAERLACFDSTFAREAETLAKRDEQERVRGAEDFGLSATQINQREQQAMAEAEASADPSRVAEAEEAATERENREIKVVSEIVEVFTDASRRQVVLLANGQVWRATSNRSFRGVPRTGWTATVKQIWSGGYRMTFEERSGFLGVSRVR